MSTGINIYANAGGFDSRLFFPGLLGVLPNSGGRSGIVGDLATSGSVQYEYKGVDYRLSIEGSAIDWNATIDLHGRVATATLEKYVNGSYTAIASMVFFPDDAVGSDEGYVNSLVSLTPDILFVQNARYDGAHLSFIGSTGADKLFGSSHNDYFIGVDGRDRLTGYGGKDEFVFDRIGKADADRITDFTIGKDTILIDRSDDPSQFKGVNGGNLQKTFHDITDQAEQKDDRIVYDRHSGALSYDADGAGGKAPVVFAYLDNHAKLDFRDFDMF